MKAPACKGIGEILLALPAPRLFPGLWIFEQQASTCYTPRYTSQSPIDIPKYSPRRLGEEKQSEPFLCVSRQLDKVEQKNLTHFWLVTLYDHSGLRMSFRLRRMTRNTDARNRTLGGGEEGARLGSLATCSAVRWASQISCLLG